MLQSKCHPQTIEVVKTRADGLKLLVDIVDEDKLQFGNDVCGVLLQYPATDGTIDNYKAIVDKAHGAKVKVRV